MFKISFCVRKKSEISAESFREYWLGEHAERLKGIVEKLGVRSLVKCEVLPTHPVGVESMAVYQTGPDLYDFVDQWHFNDIESLKKAVRDVHPTRTYGTPEDVANLVNWLASDEARYASGQLWVIDGGLTAQVQQMNL